MDIITDKWVYLENYNYGRMFAADTDKMGSSHMVETSPNGGQGDKYQWLIHRDGNDYYIQNKLRGFMFAADGDKKGDDHLAECDPSVVTLEQARAKGAQSNKWKWTIAPLNDGLRIANLRHGQLFTADQDKKGSDHLVETRPNAQQTEDKWLWIIESVTPLTNWSHCDNVKYGRMFAADQDKKDNDHLVETDPLRQGGDKYQWIFHSVADVWYAQNKKYGFMFAADNDKMDNDHIVECSPDVSTLLQAIKLGRKNTKWQWRLVQSAERSCVHLENVHYGNAFAADQDKKGNDHMVEARPGAKDVGDKWNWQINLSSAGAN